MANGSGTQQDPYIFNSFSELLEMQSEATNNTYYEYGGTATEEDMNDIYPEGLNDSLSLTGIIDFKNLVISNFRSFAQRAINFSGALKNVTFKNAIWTVGTNSCHFIYGSFTDKMYNLKIYCTIDIVSNNNESTCIIRGTDNNRNYHIDKCVIRLKGKINNDSTGGLVIFKNGAKVIDSNIIFDDFVCDNAVHIKETADSNPTGFYMIGCYIGGKLTTGNVKDTYAGTSPVTSLVSTYNIFNIETEATFTHKGYGFNIFNSTKAPNFVSDTETNIIGVTDSQLKDASYLQSINFPCYGGD